MGILECEAASGRGQDHLLTAQRATFLDTPVPCSKTVSLNTTLSSFEGGYDLPLLSGVEMRTITNVPVELLP